MIDEILELATVVPVLEVSDISNAAPLAEALAAGGLRVVELTMRTSCALDAINIMQLAAPALIVGMGTIRTAEDVEESIDAGAAFLVSPGLNESLLNAFVDARAPALPGVATTSEVMSAFEAGFKALKFFPAESAGGVAFLNSLAGPLPEINFCPTGGINASRAVDYLSLPNVACVGGTWIASKNMIEDGDWEAIEKNARWAANLEKRSKFR